MQRDYGKVNKGKAKTDWRAIFLVGLFFLLLMSLGYLVYAVKARKPFITNAITRFDQFKNWHLFSHPPAKVVAQKEAVVAEPVEFEFYDTLANKKPLSATNEESEQKIAAARNLQARINADLPNYFLQVGVYKSLVAAQQFTLALENKGFKSAIMRDSLANKTIYRVEVGPLHSEPQLKNMQHALKAQGIVSVMRETKRDLTPIILKENV